MMPILESSNIFSYSNIISNGGSLVLPASNGWLPIWQLVVASAAVFNAVQNYATLKLTQRLYARTPHLGTTASGGRVQNILILCSQSFASPCFRYLDHHFGRNSRIRRIPHPRQSVRVRTKFTCTVGSPFLSSIYDICVLSYLIAFSHFISELLIFKSCKLNGPVLSPVIVSSTCSVTLFQSLYKVFLYRCIFGVDVVSVRFLRVKSIT